jgi:hypothetical protein
MLQGHRIANCDGMAFPLAYEAGAVVVRDHPGSEQQRRLHLQVALQKNIWAL